MADSELSAILSQRQIINEGNGNGDTAMIPNKKKYFNPYTEFKEFSMKEIKEYERMFKKFDVGNKNTSYFYEATHISVLSIPFRFLLCIYSNYFENILL
ncbi:EF-hand domain-containing protein D2 [Argiope bruennichi]|uniref:EF-hand domain-containing protein D2 n=1 Tax=Argiope bruennichi TaxID=94029 RepID=A0A8T0EMC4_ARGBR|nr:EF-hand domain-containing protein D2 [Argiope bruennichi]